jgi:chromosome segregation ATPase
LPDFHASVYAKAQEVENIHPISERSIKRHLNKFQKLYNEISKLRIANFKSQQLIAKYVAKEKKIEEIGDGLTLFDYENTKTRLQIITSNIEVKNKMLEKMRMRIKKDIKDDPKYTENLNELDENLSGVEDTLRALKSEYAKLFNESKRMKNLVKQLESKLDDIYVKGQLLSERSLMVDYDKMDEKLCEKKDEVARLKDENQKLDQKFRKYEEELKTLEKEKEKAEKNVEPLSLYEERVTLFRKTRTSENLNIIQKSQKMKVPNSGMRK